MKWFISPQKKFKKAFNDIHMLRPVGRRPQGQTCLEVAFLAIVVDTEKKPNKQTKLIHRLNLNWPLLVT